MSLWTVRRSAAPITRRPQYLRIRVRPKRKPHRPGHSDDDWLVHYNAACTVAIPLVPTKSTKRRLPVPPGAKEETLVATAVEHLENYAQHADSPRVASQEAWIGSEDPDLAGLTEREEFRRWARHYLSRRLPKLRPVRSLDVAYHLRLALGHGADAMADEWRNRARNQLASADDIECWWRDEQEMWNVVIDACLEFRSWQNRLAALNAINERLGAAGREPVSKSPGWQERAGDDENYHHDRLRLIAEVVLASEHDGSPQPDQVSVPQWVGHRRSRIWEALETGAVTIGDPGLSVPAETSAALEAAKLWRRLATAVDDPRIADAAAADHVVINEAGAHVDQTFNAHLDELRRIRQSLRTDGTEPADKDAAAA